MQRQRQGVKSSEHQVDRFLRQTYGDLSFSLITEGVQIETGRPHGFNTTSVNEDVCSRCQLESGLMPLLFVGFCFQLNLDPLCLQNCHTSSSELSK